MRAADAAPARAWWPALLVAALLVYGSAYPFDFVFPAPPGAWLDLARVRAADLHLGDILANLMLFMPLGLLVALRAESPARGAAWAAAAGLLLGLGLQLLQVYLPERVPSLWDATWNTIGAVIGATATAGPLRSLVLLVRPASRFGAGLIIAWLAAEAFPFVPTLDWQSIKNGLKPLLLHPRLEPMAVLGNLVGWAALAHLWRHVVRLPLGRAGPVLALLGALCAQVLVVHRAPSASGVVGGTAGVALALLPWRPGHLRWLLLALVAGWLAVSGLAPFALRDQPGAFQWLPLAGFLRGSIFTGIWVGLEKIFWYGLLLELLLASGCRLRSAAVAGMILLGGIEWGQRWIAAPHVAEITDPLLLAALATVRAAWSRDGRAPAGGDAPDARTGTCP